MSRVFIDGSHGTTGLRIFERLSSLSEYEVFNLPYENSKDLNTRIKAIDSADVAVLCLPDASSKEIVAHIKNTKIIDTSTAHRVNAGFTYGFAELGLRDEISTSSRVAVPGCHVSGFLSTVTPLVSEGVIDKDSVLSCHSITGYSGGGKSMIAEYTAKDRAEKYKYPRQYALTLSHKHLKEMKHFSKLTSPPIFSPIVADVYSGMAVSVPLMLPKGKYTGENIVHILKEYYQGEQIIKVYDFNEHPAIENGFLDPAYKQGKDDLDIVVCGSDEQLMLISLFDNLGKGASGAALQCLNIMCGKNEILGLSL